MDNAVLMNADRNKSIVRINEYRIISITIIIIDRLLAIGIIIISIVQITFSRENENLYQLYGKPTILTFIRTKRMKLFGHIWRAEDDILKKVITATIQKKRPLGGPRTRWKDAVKRDIQLVDANASVELALNRER
jgi:hypothetical protein